MFITANEIFFHHCSSQVYNHHKIILTGVLCMLNWGGSRGGLGGSVEPPKLNVKRITNAWLKKVNQLS